MAPTPSQVPEPLEQGGEARFRLMVERNLAAIILCELLFDEAGAPVDYRLLMANAAFEAQTGVAVQDVVGKCGAELDFAWPEAVRQALFRVALTGEPIAYERFNERVGRWFDASVFCPQRGEFVLMFLDITQRKEGEAAIKESERFLKQAQKAGRTGTYDWRIQEDRWFSSEQMDEIFGIDAAWPKTLEGWVGLVAPEERDRLAAYVAHILAEDLPFDLDYEILRPRDGQRRWVHGQGELEKDAQGHPTRLLGVIQDISEKKQAQAERERLEAEMHHAQKLESLGRLAGGVAHDMNNVLGAIQAVTETLLQVHDGDPRLTDALGVIEKASLRGRDLVKGLLDFARKDLREARPLDLNTLVKEEAALLVRTLPRRVSLVLDLEDPLPAILGEKGPLGSVLMNLCVNASDAMPEGGTLTLRTRALKTGQVELQVEDTGQGMAPDVLARAAEPFYTTKPFGRGTGLGLARAHAVARAHRGGLHLRSQEGRGTCATLRFPASALPEAPDAPEGPVAAVPGLDLLLVDDDDLIRATAPGLLALLGHRCQAVPGGQEALDHLQGDAPVDLVILDVNMPGLDGLETLARLRADRPTLPVLLATGFLDGKVEAALAGDPHLRGLQKPLTLAQLREGLTGLV